MPHQKYYKHFKNIFIAFTWFATLYNFAGCSFIPVSKISSPKAGLVIFVNSNEWAEGEIFLFPPDVRRGDLFDISSKGVFEMKRKPILRVPIKAAPATNVPFVASAQLLSNQAYTIVTLWQNKVGQFINFTYGYIRTSDNGFNEIFTDFLGRQFFADRVVYLPRVAAWEAKPYQIVIIGPG